MADGENIDLNAMPRPHRRRREKKLMTMDEVNERFPITKYKAWRSTREQEGLPAAGGITAPPSRAASIKDADGTISVAGPKKSIDTARPVSSTSQAVVPDGISIHEAVLAASSLEASSNKPEQEKEKEKEDAGKGEKKTQTANTEQENNQIGGTKEPAGKPSENPPKNTTTSNDNTNTHQNISEDEEEDDDDPIATAAPPELLAAPGDTCAICLDVIEDEDDIRGLTCGHAFHASCVDPWLTSRRACCPLCKADYYIPKPRPEGEQQPEQPTGRRSTGFVGVRINMPGMPQQTYLGGRSRSRGRTSGPRFLSFPGNRLTEQAAQNESGRAGFFGAQQNVPDAPQPAPWRSRLHTFRVRNRPRPSMPSMPGWMRRNGNNNATSEHQPNPTQTTTTEVTPAALEEGRR
jgi:hypothetical protein